MFRRWAPADPMPIVLMAMGTAVVGQAALHWSSAIAWGAVAVPVLAGLGMAAVVRGGSDERGTRGEGEGVRRGLNAGLVDLPGPDTLNQSDAWSCVESRDRFSHTAANEIVALDLDDGDEAGGMVLQQWSRRIDPHGQEVLSGEVRIEYPDGARLAVAHIPWQPAFSGLPEVSLEAVDGDEAEVQLDQLRSFGMRLTARRSEASCGFTVVAFHVQARQSLRAAA
jgi:hypothetical protein